jgi:hypothetical protein
MEVTDKMQLKQGMESNQPTLEVKGKLASRVQTVFKNMAKPTGQKNPRPVITGITGLVIGLAMLLRTANGDTKTLTLVLGICAGAIVLILGGIYLFIMSISKHVGGYKTAKELRRCYDIESFSVDSVILKKS